MVRASASPMDALAIGEFLATQQTGVLALSRNGHVYAVPVSFAYDEDGSDFFFNLGYGPRSEKRSFVEAGAEAAFVVYDRTEQGWRSVVAEGRLEPLSDTSLDSSIVQAVNRLDIPFFGTHRRPAGELEFAVVRLATNKLSGIADGRPAAQVN